MDRTEGRIFSKTQLNVMLEPGKCVWYEISKLVIGYGTWECLCRFTTEEVVVSLHMLIYY